MGGRAGPDRKSSLAPASPVLSAPEWPPKPGCRVAPVEGRLAMEIHSTPIRTTLGPVAELDRLGDEIAELSAHLEAATARLLDLIREFDARGGWGNGFRSCADWLSWRIGLDLGAAREKVRVARALATLPLPGGGARPRGAVVRQGPRPDPRRHAGDRSAAARGGARRHGRPRRADRARLALHGSQGRGAGDRSDSTRAGRCTSTRTRTARWCSAGGWSRRWAPCS